MATIVAAAGGGNWGTGGTWVGGVVPTAADDVQLTGTSGNVTINVAAFCRSLDCTGYIAILGHNSGITLTIGDGTAGAGNVALKLVAGMTYTLGNAITSAIAFISTAASQQTITTGGKTLANWTVNGVGCSYLLADANTVGTAATVTLTNGTLNTGGQACSWGLFNANSGNVRTLTLGASAIAITGGSTCWNVDHTNLTLTANTAVVTLSGAAAYFAPTTNSNQQGMSLVFTGSGIARTSVGTVANLTRTGTAATTNAMNFDTNLTTTGTFTINGNSAVNRVLCASGVLGTARTITAASVSISNTDFQDITGAGAGSWNLAAITGGAGDCGGNTAITFTTAATQTWQGIVSGNWSDVSKWTSRVPLPQDNVIIAAAFSASQTISADMPRLGKSIDFTGTTGSPAWTNGGSFTTNNYGSLTLIAGMSVSFSGAHSFGGRSTYTITSAGKNFTPNMALNAPGGTYTLLDAFSTTNTLSVNAGTLTTNGNTITAGLLSVQTVGSTLNLGSSIVNLTSTGAVTIFFRGNSGVITAGAATINIVNASANERLVSASAVDLSNATFNYTVSGSTGTLYITDTFSIGTFNFTDSLNARTLKLAASRTMTVKTLFNVNGTAGKLMSIISSTAATTATVSQAAGYVNCDYLSLQDSTATGGASWYAGVNSTNVSNNTGWFFQAYSPSKFLIFL